MSESKEVSVPAEIYEKLSESLAGSGARSIDELAERIIRDWITKKEAGSRGFVRKRVSKADEKTMEDRLRALGYV